MDLVIFVENNKYDIINNDKIKNEDVKNEDVKNKDVKNKEIKNEESKNEDIKKIKFENIYNEILKLIVDINKIENKNQKLDNLLNRSSKNIKIVRREAEWFE